MKTTLASYPDNTYEVELHFRHEQRGYGQWNLLCEVTIPGTDNKRTFRHYMTDVEFIDNLSDMRSDNSSHEDIQMAYYEKCFYALEESVIEWIESIQEDNA